MVRMNIFHFFLVSQTRSPVFEDHQVLKIIMVGIAMIEKENTKE